METTIRKSKSRGGYVFVYGSLKTGGYFSKKFDSYRRGVWEARVKGILYDLGSYPGLVLGGENYVYGELHYYDSLQEVIRELNWIEGYRGRGDSSNLYNLLSTEIEFVGGGKRKGMLYSINLLRVEVKKYRTVKSGFWPIKRGDGTQA